MNGVISVVLALFALGGVVQANDDPSLDLGGGALHQSGDTSVYFKVDYQSKDLTKSVDSKVVVVTFKGGGALALGSSDQKTNYLDVSLDLMKAGFSGENYFVGLSALSGTVQRNLEIGLDRMVIISALGLRFNAAQTTSENDAALFIDLAADLLSFSVTKNTSPFDRSDRGITYSPNVSGELGVVILDRYRIAFGGRYAYSNSDTIVKNEKYGQYYDSCHDVETERIWIESTKSWEIHYQHVCESVMETRETRGAGLVDEYGSIHMSASMKLSKTLSLFFKGEYAIFTPDIITPEGYETRVGQSKSGWHFMLGASVNL